MACHRRPSCVTASPCVSRCSHAGGPCYRCVHPRPPPPETVTNCSDGGVLGVVPGVIGSLQALEALRLLTPGLRPAHVQSLLLFDGLLGAFRSVRLRGRQPDCAVCGDRPTVTQLQDYVQFCGAAPTDKVTGRRREGGREGGAGWPVIAEGRREWRGGRR